MNRFTIHEIWVRETAQEYGYDGRVFSWIASHPIIVTKYDGRMWHNAPSINIPVRTKPKHFIIGAKDFDAWLKGCKNMPDTYACIKNRNEYILLNQGWCAHITNQQD